MSNSVLTGFLKHPQRILFRARLLSEVFFLLPFLTGRIRSGHRHQIIKSKKPAKTVIIFSVINPIEKPLSYSSKRSIFSPEERYKQTRETLKSIREWDPDAHIVVLELSDFKWPEIHCSVHYLAANFKAVKMAVESPFKGLGQAVAFCFFIQTEAKNCEELWWISGRYKVQPPHTPMGSDGIYANFSGGLLATTLVGFRGRKTLDQFEKRLWECRWKLLLNRSLEQVITEIVLEDFRLWPRREVLTGQVGVSGHWVKQ